MHNASPPKISQALDQGYPSYDGTALSGLVDSMHDSLDEEDSVEDDDEDLFHL